MNVGMRVSPRKCRAHARRKLYEAHEINGSHIAGHAVSLMARLYVIERDIQQLEDMDAATRLRIRQERARPLAEELHEWLTSQRHKLVASDATAKAVDYSLGRWRAVTR